MTEPRKFTDLLRDEQSKARHVLSVRRDAMMNDILALADLFALVI